MRGDERVQDGMFSYVSLEQRVPQDHPLRTVRKLTDRLLGSSSSEFDGLYASSGRPSIAPEYILRALLLQVFYSVRSERLLVEQIDYNLLFRWFVGLGMDDAVWNHAVFSQNRDRLLTSDVAQNAESKLWPSWLPLSARRTTHSSIFLKICLLELWVYIYFHRTTG
jgi:transposase